MGKVFAILDATGKMIASHSWGSTVPPEHCPIDPPPGGSIMALEDDTAMNLMRGGQQTVIKGDKVEIDGIEVGVIKDGKIEWT